MECPVCDDVALVISSREGVEIDHCPQCRGVWLDRGELDKILDRTAALGAAPVGRESAREAVYREPRYEPPPSRGRDDRYDDRYDDRRRRAKRRSFLDDLFDFD